MDAMLQEPSKTKNPREKSSKRRSFKQRQAAAELWLERLGQVVTKQRVDELAGYVDNYAPGSRYGQIADAMVKNGAIPTFPLVKARYESRAAARERYLGRTEPAVEIDDDVRGQIAQIITNSWSRLGRGPAWTEIREAAGWTRHQTRAVIHTLASENFVSFTTEEGSLRLATGS